MRTQFLQYIGLLSFVAGGLATGGCSDITAGHPADPSGPPRLVRALIQDPFWTQGAQPSIVIDLFDPTTPAQLVACDDTHPCQISFLVAQSIEHLCSAATGPGVCSDPTMVPPTGIPITAAVGAPPNDAGSGIAIRLVFNKLLDASNNKIETVTPIPNAPVGKNLKYALNPGIAELDTADDGNEWPIAALGPGSTMGNIKYWDATGNPTLTSDLIAAPLGPAIVLKPNTPLSPNTKYAIKINPTMLKDRQGNAPADANGNPLPNPYIINFTTENLKLSAAPGAPAFGAPPMAATVPDITMTPITIKPNNVLQFMFQAPADPTTAVFTVTGPNGQPFTTAFAYTEAGSVAAMCSMNANPFQVDIVNVSAVHPQPTAVDWPAGNYTMSFTLKDGVLGHSTYTSPTFMFTVAGTSDPMDPNGYQKHLLPKPDVTMPPTMPGPNNCSM